MSTTSAKTIDFSLAREASGPMQVLQRSIYRGPHLFGALPMIRLQLDLGALEERPTDSLPSFTDRLLASLPGMAEHGCSYKTPGGLIKRLESGTWIGHVVEHVALELQTVAGTPVTRGKTRSVKGRLGVYNVLFTYRHEAVGLAAGFAALRLVDSLLPTDLRGLVGVERADEPFDLGVVMTELNALVRRASLGPTTAALGVEARRIFWRRPQPSRSRL